MTRTIDCVCGHTLRADDDDELLARVREHVDTTHPDMQASEEQLRELVIESAQDDFGGA